MKYNININPNQKIVDEIKTKIHSNSGYCPCKLIKNEDTKCMCKEFRERNSAGYCHCGLYLKVKVETSEEKE